MKKLEEKKMELEVLEIALDSLQTRKQWIVEEVEGYMERRKEEDFTENDYETRNNTRNLIMIKKYDDLIEKLEKMI